MGQFDDSFWSLGIGIPAALAYSLARTLTPFCSNVTLNRPPPYISHIRCQASQMTRILLYRNSILHGCNNAFATYCTIHTSKYACIYTSTVHCPLSMYLTLIQSDLRYWYPNTNVILISYKCRSNVRVMSW